MREETAEEKAEWARKEKEWREYERRYNQFICDTVERVVDYAHSQHVDTIVLGGRGAGPFYEVFRVIWGRKYGRNQPRSIQLGN